MVMSYSQRTRPDCKIESCYTRGRQNKIDCFSVDGFCSQCNAVFEAMGGLYHFCPRKELRPSLTEEDIKRGSRKRELDELRRSYIQEKGFIVIEEWQCERWRLYRTTTNIKSHVPENFPYRRSLTEHQLLERIKKKTFLATFKATLKYLKTWEQTLLTVLQYSGKLQLARIILVIWWKHMPKKKQYCLNLGKCWYQASYSQNGTPITPQLLFYLQLGLVDPKRHRFVEYTPKKCFNSFVQSAVDTRRQGDENPNSSVVAETMKLLANSSYGYQIMDRSQHTVTRYLIDEKTHAAINSKMFKKLDHVNNSL